MIDYITKGHIIVLIIGVLSSLGLASFIYQLSNCKNKFVIEPKPKPKPITKKPVLKQNYAYQPSKNMMQKSQMNNIPRHMQLKMNSKSSYQPRDLVNPSRSIKTIQPKNMGYPSLNNRQVPQRMQQRMPQQPRNIPSQIRSNTGPVIRNKTSIDQIF